MGRKHETRLRLVARVAIAVACVLGWLATTGATVAAAQIVRGIVVDSASRLPLGDVTVSLVDAVGAVVAGGVSDATGRYTLHAPAGAYRFRAQRIGYRLVARPLVLSADAVERGDVAMPASLVRLSAVRAEARTSCRIRGTIGATAQTVWAEVRTALDATIVTERVGLARLTVRDTERELDPRSLAARTERSVERSGVTASPYDAPPAESLSVNGYSRQLAGTTWYYAPGAATLASESFAADHCLWLVRDGAPSPGLIGLRFEPVRSRRVVDITGTAWVDVATAELRSVEFAFTGLPDWARGHALGGRVDFGRVPGTGWIVRRWTVRAPRVGSVERSGFESSAGGGIGSGRMTTRRVDSLVAIQEAGGEVLTATSALAQPRDPPVVAWSAGHGTVRGVVFDSMSGGPLAGADVRLVGTDVHSTSDVAGTYFMRDVSTGRHGLTFAHAAAVGSPAPRWFDVPADSAVVVDLFVPSAEALLAARCASLVSERDSGLVFGIVRRDGSADPVAGVPVAVSWTRYSRWGPERLRAEPLTVRATSDSAGAYHVCGVPIGVLARVQTDVPQGNAATVSLVVRVPRAKRVDLVIHGRPPG